MFSFYPHFEYSLAAIQLILSMTGMGATLTRAEFRAIWRRPQTIAGVMVVQYLVLPAFATVVASLTGVPPGIALGMVLINSVPSGAFTNVFTYLGHGNVTLSIVMTCASTAICFVTTPLAIDWFSAAELPNDFHIPFSTTVFPVVAFLLVPMIVGMWIARYVPRRKQQIAKWAVRELGATSSDCRRLTGQRPDQSHRIWLGCSNRLSRIRLCHSRSHATNCHADRLRLVRRFHDRNRSLRSKREPGHRPSGKPLSSDIAQRPNWPGSILRDAV